MGVMLPLLQSVGTSPDQIYGTVLREIRLTQMNDYPIMFRDAAARASSPHPSLPLKSGIQLRTLQSGWVDN